MIFLLWGHLGHENGKGVHVPSFRLYTPLLCSLSLHKSSFKTRGLFALAQILMLPDELMAVIKNCISSVESQKGDIDIQRCSVENQKGAITVQSLYGDSALLVFNRTSLNSGSALLPHTDDFMIGKIDID